ncbi:AMP-dependent synthetase/ligase [Sinanaerobacter chloroacetimidivorans]|uniref:AMP-binding protein n=1 Tax=Sinanaerobacter chloroacetimidivorans TaxID=2818044 RepID=A0A8J7W2M4_9FIRM|nr:AMP-binding protein [Sinanaerobacter chloroacetimidivorans]MBR0598038.1 AMP-binding protein [Sinanaerobacter chloroacetimidivorans]
MNSAKYKDEIYIHRPIRDLKDMIDTSAVLYADKNAFLVKNAPGGKYIPIKFSEFKSDIDGLGTAFMDLGLTGKKIAVIGENRYEWVVTYLAVVNGTGVIVPLDRELPAQEIHNLLVRAGVSAVVYSSKVGSVVEEAIREIDSIEYIISMDTLESTDNRLSLKKLVRTGNRLLMEEKRFFVDAVIDPEAMCSLLFTSGTTGMAKGVMLSHKNLTANVYNMSKYVDVSKNFTGLSVLPMHHTYELTCHVFTSMYQGCCVAICEGLKYIVKNMAEAQATVMLGVPLIFESMHKKVWKKAEDTGKADKMRAAVQLSKKLGKFNIKSTKKLFKSVHQAMGGNMQLLISGAAAIDPMVIEDFNAMGFTMIQGYGMTENSPIIAVNKDRYHKPASVGLPMPGTEIRIIDQDDNGVGEIICKGDSVMLGYYDNPEETAKVLVDGWLHTGDYGYFDKDGFLYISGRKKNVIVTKNGKNIFPEEVEFYLNKSDYISEVLVWGMEDEKSGDTIVCAEIFPDFPVIEEKKGKLSEEALRKLLKAEIDEANEKMPLYKRVKRFEIREKEFEKTTTKKIKRYAANHK